MITLWPEQLKPHYDQDIDCLENGQIDPCGIFLVCYTDARPGCAVGVFSASEIFERLPTEQQDGALFGTDQTRASKLP